MSRSTGLGQRLYLDGINLSGDIGSIDNCSSPLTVIDVTRLGKSAYERRATARDAALEYTAFFNPSDSDTYVEVYGPAGPATHPVLAALPAADVVQTYCTGTTIGDPAAGLVAKQVGYAAQRGNDGSFTFSVSTQANGYGLDWGRLVTPAPRLDSAPTNGDGYDFGTGATTYGLQAYLQVVAFAGTTCTVKLQESSDDGVADTWADITGGSFGPQNTISASRISTTRTQTVKRYLRAVTTGTFDYCTFVVAVKRNDVATPI